MRNSKGSKSRYYVDVGTDPNYPYNCVDVKTNDIVWNFVFEEDALEWCNRQNKVPTFEDFDIPLHLRNVKQ